MDKAQSKRVNGIILIVDDELSARQTMEAFLTRERYEIRCAPDGQTGMMFAQEEPPDLILLDIRLPDFSGIEVCQRLKQDQRTQKIPIIFITALEDLGSKIEGFKAGAVDYITKPYQLEEVLTRVRTHLTLQDLTDQLERRVEERTADLQKSNEQLSREIEQREQAEKALQERLEEIERLKQRLEQENIYLQEEVSSLIEHKEIIGESDSLKRILLRAGRVARTDSTVLITGETGTGKELLARWIHGMSPRKNRALVGVNCASLPPTLIESELFGREKGAYTGALTRMVGRFEMADGGTIFLDEIGELPLEVQSKLLRVLEAGQFERLGSTKTLQVNVRIIAASNRDIDRDVNEGKFRKDLYYRLNVFPIAIPSLRERSEDIPLLVWAFVKQLEKKMGKRIENIPRKTMEALKRFMWPGNVRELRNVLEHAMIVSAGKTLTVQMPHNSSSEKHEDRNLADMEREHILSVLGKTGWRITGSGGAAEALGLKRTTLQSRMKKLEIKRPGT